MAKEKPRVVVLDDNEHFRAMVAAVLDYDYDVVLGHNGVEGLKLCLTATHFTTNPSRQFEKDPRVQAIMKKPFETEALLKLVHSVVPVPGAGPAPAK